MEETRRGRYSHLYETGSAEASAGEGEYSGETEEYRDDLKLIEQICAHNDLEDRAANRKLYRHLRKEAGFSTWIGEAFLSGLLGQTSNNRHRQTIEKVCKRIAVSFLAMAVVLLLVLLYFQIKEAQENAVLDYIRQERELLAKAATEVREPDIVLRPDVLDQYTVMYSMYPDLVGWLKVEGTGIDYPVMQDVSGQEYYLNHNFEGREDNKGNPFIDHQSSIDPLDKNIVIYGHNMNNGSQFGNLDYYLDEDFYRKHPTFTFDTIYETGIYRIVAVVRTHVKQGNEGGFRYYWFHNYENRGAFQELLDFISEGSVYDTGEHLTYGDSTVMLSTCEYTVEYGRLVVIAKRIDE